MARSFDELSNEYIDQTLAESPVTATYVGVHDYDHELPDYSRGAVEARTRKIRGWVSELEGMDTETKPEGWPGYQWMEADLLWRRLQWELVTLEEWRGLANNPTLYANSIGSALLSLMIRDFAPAAERAASAASRVAAIPNLLSQARENLEQTTSIHIKTALEGLAGVRGMVADEAAAFCGSALDEATRDKAVRAIDEYRAFLGDDLAKREEMPIAIGEAVFAKQVEWAEVVDTDLARLRREGEEDLRRTQARLVEVAGQIDDTKSAAEVVDQVSLDFPDARNLVRDTAALLEDLRQFSIDAKLVTMPTEVRISVTETPEFYRSVVQAACSTPGAFETRADESYYWVTPVEDNWSEEQKSGFLKFLNRWAIPGISAHEAYPGHYVHLIAMQQEGSRLAQFLRSSTTTVEGWAHYVEQVMIEAGYGGGDPRLELMQLREALLRLCRYLASFGMHTGGWSFEQAVGFFIKEGYSTPIIAERESRRGVVGPNYYAYTLGKHEILRLRDKYREQRGAGFSLLDFHDRFIRLPYPVAVIERIMLNGDARTENETRDTTPRRSR
ncbi:MAG: DUF885 domain-containing protein [Dehalococcoidia bacterium]